MTVWWSLLGLRLPIIGIIIIFLNQPLIEIIFIHIRWAGGVLWFRWSFQGWRETSRRSINKVDPSVNTPPPLSRFSLKVFLWMVKFNHSIGNVDLHYRVWFVHSISFTNIFVFLSSYFDTEWWITLFQYFLFLVLNKVWSWMLFVFSKVTIYIYGSA